MKGLVQNPISKGQLPCFIEQWTFRKVVCLQSLLKFSLSYSYSYRVISNNICFTSKAATSGLEARFPVTFRPTQNFLNQRKQILMRPPFLTCKSKLSYSTNNLLWKSQMCVTDIPGLLSFNSKPHRLFNSFLNCLSHNKKAAHSQFHSVGKQRTTSVPTCQHDGAAYEHTAKKHPPCWKTASAVSTPESKSF